MNEEAPSGLASRVVASIVICAAWLVFVLVFAVFYASNFGLLQSVVIVLVSLIIVGAAIGAMWASWGIRFGYAEERKKRKK